MPKLVLFLLFLLVTAALCMLTLSGCGASDDQAEPHTMHVSTIGKIKSLDPALCADVTSAKMVSSLYDNLLEYDYTARPYKLIPALLAEMPKVSDDQLTYTFTLRKDIYFAKDECFGKGSSKEKRRITSRDAAFSLLRIADARVHSSGFWLFRGKVVDMDDFRKRSETYDSGDLSLYDKGCKGIEVVDDETFRIKLVKPYPRLLYVLAMSYASIVSRTAVEHYGDDFANHPVSSGPFVLREWIRNYRIIMVRNPDFRKQYFKDAVKPEDRTKPLPLLDKVVCYMVSAELSSWLMFLQGELDMSALDNENFDAVVDDKQQLIPALKERGIKMFEVPVFQINYVAFCQANPLLAENENLRQAITYAYDVQKRVKNSNYRLRPAQGPIPPGVPGYDPKYKNPYGTYDLAKAKEYLKKAGFPDGIDPKTGKPLELTFDQMGTSNRHRQQAEMMVDDMKKIGIKIIPNLNHKPRFLQKSRKGQLQLFRLGWVGDYPDAENFLQLFYGPNAGSSNRAFFRDKTFDKMYEEVVYMPDCPERTKKYTAMAKYLTTRCPWIFESNPISYQLTHGWLENYVPHDFAYNRWKYLAVDYRKRQKMKKSFKPISMRDLQ